MGKQKIVSPVITMVISLKRNHAQNKLQQLKKPEMSENRHETVSQKWILIVIYSLI